MKKKQTSYISCIKINGVPILPPIMTEEKYKLMRKYKTQALNVEKRLEEERELRQYLCELQYNTSVKQPESEQNIASHIINVDEMANQSKLSKLTCDIEITEYISDNLHESQLQVSQTQKDFSPIEENGEYCTIQSIQETDVQLEDYESPIATNAKEESSIATNEKEESSIASNAKEESSIATNEKEESSIASNAKEESETSAFVGRLLRSNSYTLISPSPVLLQYLQNTQEFRKYHPQEEFLRTPEDLNNTMDFFDTTTSCTELKDISDNDTMFSENENTIKPIHIANVDQVIENVNNNEEEGEGNKSLEFSELKDILSKIPEEYSKKIIQLLDNQKINYKNDDAQDLRGSIKSSNYPTSNNTSISTNFNDIQCNPEKYSTPLSHRGDANDERTLYYTITSETLEDNDFESCSVNEDSIRNNKQMTRERAASVICAAARSYLVRRLLSTTKVQTLIQTIKDALLCAVDLHKESLENINESDVELHRRLIQQVSAACYAFHDLFFKTSVSERMYIIALDRQKKKDLIKKNALNLSIGSNRSTPRAIRVRKSLSATTI